MAIVNNWGEHLRSVWHWLKDRLQSGWLMLPIVGPLVNCTWADHRASIKEFMQSVAFATMTFWLTAVILMVFRVFERDTFSEALARTVQEGQLLIFAVAFMGPILIIAAEDPKYAREFPGRSWHFLALILLAATAAALYALQLGLKIGQIGDVLNSDLLLDMSVWISAFALLLRYLSIVYRKQSADPERVLKGPEQNFMKAFVGRHGDHAQ